MIEISYANAFCFYLLFWLLTLAILWWREIRRQHFRDISRNDHLFVCSKCRHASVTREVLNASRCPSCNAMSLNYKPRQY